MHDTREEINEIGWTVAGKVRSVSRTPGSAREPLNFAYGASGQRTPPLPRMFPDRSSSLATRGLVPLPARG